MQDRRGRGRSPCATEEAQRSQRTEQRRTDNPRSSPRGRNLQEGDCLGGRIASDRLGSAPGHPDVVPA